MNFNVPQPLAPFSQHSSALDFAFALALRRERRASALRKWPLRGAGFSPGTPSSTRAAISFAPRAIHSSNCLGTNPVQPAVN